MQLFWYGGTELLCKFGTMLRRGLIRPLVGGGKIITKAATTNHSLIPKSQRESSQFQLIHTSALPQAGHNKWSKIKRPKAIADLRRSKLFTKYIMQIMSSVRVDGGPNPQVNNRLSHLITQARVAGVSKANIESAIHKASDASKDGGGELVLYEARGKGGYSLLIEVLTDSTKKTRPILKHFLSKKGCMMGEIGSSSFNFDYKGIIRVPSKELLASHADTLELAIEVGAEDVIADNPEVESSTMPPDHDVKSTTKSHDHDIKSFAKSHDHSVQQSTTKSPDNIESTTYDASVSSSGEEECCQFSCEPRDLKRVSDAIRNKSFTISSASLEYIPKTHVLLKQEDFDKAVSLVNLLSEREEVMEVYDDFALSD